jgi:hypothetical protein
METRYQAAPRPDKNRYCTLRVRYNEDVGEVLGKGWFLENIIDYAGIFPPAALPTAEAFRNYQAFLKGKQGWIVGALAWSATEIPALIDLAKQAEIEVAVIGRGSTDWATWQDARAQDAEAMNALLEACPGVEIAAYESRVTPISEIETAIRALKKMSEETSVVIELPWNEPIEDALAALAEAEWPVAKFRTGGQNKEAYPTPDQLANILHQCVNLDIRFKLTAGLHEPLAHLEASNGAWSHGFLNVIAAVSLAFHEDATVRELTEVLSDGDPSHWSVHQDLHWRNHAFSQDKLDDVRTFFGSFGSCSVDEPLAGMDRLEK